MGTSVGGDVFEDVRAEAVKHDVPERVEGGIGKAKKRGGDMINGMRNRGAGGGKARTRRQNGE